MTAGASGGLLPVRPARPIRAGERVHVVGSAGAGASAAALHARWVGGDPDGCDPGGPSPYTAALLAAGIELAWEHDPAHVRRSPPPDRLAVTKALTAIDPHHPELEAARGAGIPIEPWQQVVADAAIGRLLIGIAGTHGKSTTAGWLVHVLVAAGGDPSAFVGALLPGALTGGIPATARRGAGPAFVVEADEYAGNFDAYRPAVTVLTSAEWDHPDVFADRDSVIAAFERWIRMMDRLDASPALIANMADPGVAQLVARLHDWPGQVVATALIDGGDRDGAGEAAAVTGGQGTRVSSGGTVTGRILRLDPDGTSIEVRGLDAAPGGVEVRLATAGRHNAANALGVAAAARAVGVPVAAIVAGLATFGGVGRRLERVGDVAGVAVFDDYAHHPTAIRETLAAVRQRVPGRPVWAVYEPLTYHRTAAMLEGFADALAGADAVAIAAIWPGRDSDTSIASADRLAEAVARRNPAIEVAAPGSVEATAAWLAGVVRRGDAVLVMGGGRSYRIGELLIEALADR